MGGLTLPPVDDGQPSSNVDGVVRASYDWSERRPCSAIVETVAIAADREPTAIEPMYEAIDPDALDGLVRSNGAVSTGASGSPDGTVELTFAFAGHDVSVDSNGEVVVRPGGERIDPET